jgi:hypothetical protein
MAVFKHRTQGPRKGTGNGFIARNVEPSRKRSQRTLTDDQIEAMSVHAQRERFATVMEHLFRHGTLEGYLNGR